MSTSTVDTPVALAPKAANRIRIAAVAMLCYAANLVILGKPDAAR